MPSARLCQPASSSDKVYLLSSVADEPACCMLVIRRKRMSVHVALNDGRLALLVSFQDVMDNGSFPTVVSFQNG